MQGNLPSELGRASNLGEREKSLTGVRIVTSIDLIGLQLPERLLIANNDLNGTLPAELRNCASLNKIDLSDNEFIGGIPSEWVGLQQLGT